MVLAVSPRRHGGRLRRGAREGPRSCQALSQGKAEMRGVQRAGGEAATHRGCCGAERSGTGAACTLGPGCPAVATPKEAHLVSPKRFPPCPLLLPVA